VAARKGNALITLALVCLVAALAVTGAWLAMGGHFVTQYQTAQTVEEQDEFGDTIERTVMVDDFQFGLMPDKGYDAALPYIAAGGGGFVFFLFLGLRARRNTA